MGNQQTKPSSSLDDWQKVNQQNGIEIYKNKINNELAQKRLISIDPQYDLKDQMKIYKMRQHNNDSLIRAFGLENITKKKSSEGICSTVNRVSVLTERVLYRLSELPQLTFPQILLVLKQSLKGYSKVYKNYGPIHVTSNLIGINDNGQVKVWVNQNWAMNHPNHDLPTLQSTKLQDLSKQEYLAYGAKYRDQTQMVHNILAVVEEKCQEGKFPKAFAEQVPQHSSTFKKLELYLQDFIHYNQIFIPPKINYETVFVSKFQKNNQIQQTSKVQQDQQKTNIIQPSAHISTNQYDNTLYGYKMYGNEQFRLNQAQKGPSSVGYTTNTFSQNVTINKPSQTGNTFSINTNTTTTPTINFKPSYISSTNNNNISSTTFNNDYRPASYQTTTFQPTSYSAFNNNTNQVNFDTNKRVQGTLGNYYSSSINPSSTLFGNETGLNKQIRATFNQVNSLGSPYENTYRTTSNINTNYGLNNLNPENNYALKTFKEYSGLSNEPLGKVDYSFDNINNNKIYESSKFGGQGYQGTGYSNTLTKYEFNKFTTNNDSPFSMIMKPTNNLSENQENINKDLRNYNNANNYEQSLQNLAKMAERASNDVTESAIKQF